MEQENNVEQEIQTNPLEDLINHSLGQDYNKANQVFGDLMGQKVQDALDQEKIRVADTVFNGMKSLKKISMMISKHLQKMILKAKMVMKMKKLMIIMKKMMK